MGSPAQSVQLVVAGGERLRPMVLIDQTCLGGNLEATKPLHRSKLLPQFEGLCLASPSSTWGRTCSSPSTSLYTSFSTSSSSFFSSSRGRRTEGGQGCQLQALGKSLSRASSPRTTMRGAGWSLPFPSHQGRKTPR